MRIAGVISWCSVSCVCHRCLASDASLSFLTTNNFVKTVRFER